MYRYFSSVDKLPKLPDPTASLLRKYRRPPLFWLNAGVKRVLQESFGEGKLGFYVKLSSDHVDDGYRAL